MVLADDLKKVAVIGAAGKMGSGITLLLLIEIANQELKLHGKLGSSGCRLKAIDPNEEGLAGLKKYLRKQLLRYAEKNINALREAFANQPNLISNEEIILAFIAGALDMTDFGRSIDEAKGCSLIFEAALEEVGEKAKIFKQLKNEGRFFFTNTSSIPIQLLSEKGEIEGRLIGFHFYNPPVVQKLIEIIAPEKVDPELKKEAEELAKLLNKVFVHSADVAGFIGNGFFVREICFAISLLNELAQEMGLTLAIQKIDSLTKNFLLRPMGIFQLIDYVGIDVAKKILHVMRTYLSDPVLQAPMIDEWLKAGIKGGQNFDGTPKDGLFQYSDSQPIKVFDFAQKKYVPLNKELGLGKPPLDYTWKALQKDPQRQEKIAEYFAKLLDEKTEGAVLASKYLKRCQEISKKLVEDRVAKSSQDVNLVLQNGFYHLYGPDTLI